MSRPRIGRRQLEGIRANLTDRDLDILKSVATNRFLTSGQIRRLFFFDKPTRAATVRSTNRTLAKLADLQLIDALKRRIGGVRAGSSAHVWSLAPAGGRLLETTGGFDGIANRVREYEPTPTFLEHNLAVAEVCLTLSEAERRGDITVLELQREPDCWRAYSASGGGVARLKPDLAVVTASGDFEDHWFLEIDLDTEPPSRIVRTCFRYEAYQSSGEEQERLGVFPAVVWAVLSSERKSTLQQRIASESRLRPGLFGVCLLGDLLPLMQTGMAPQENGHES
jgi:hypothetical protein